MNNTRLCSVTGQNMTSGWCFFDGEHYAATEDAALQLANQYGYETIDEAYDADACYWTEWN